MTFKKMLLYPIENPMRPVLLAFLSLPLLGLGMLGNIEMLSALGGILFLISLVLLFISFFYFLVKREWRKSFYILLFIATIAMILGLLN